MKAARFAETLNVTANLREWEHRLRIDYLATDAASGLRVCKGTSIQVAVDHQDTRDVPEVTRRPVPAAGPHMKAASLLGLLLSGLLQGANASAATPPGPPPTPAAAAQVKPQESVFAHPATPAQLATITGDTARSIAGAKVVRGRFVQRRHLAGLARPLESSGTFLFARGSGIDWHTEQPFDSQFLLTGSRITQRDEGGVSLEIDAAEQPALAVVSRVFFALFALDLDALSHDFELYGERVGDAGWVLGLKPRTEALASVFRQALVRG